MHNRIEKRIELKAPVARVWRAISDSREFGTWFKVKIEGPFVAGHQAEGQITHPGYEHVRWKAVIRQIEPERLFSFTWYPYAIGTLLTVTETGFDKVPASRRAEAFRMNDSGWAQQMKNIEAHVARGG
jgi:uncharacterized protein YndB with AHSA1/START domain